MASTWVHRAGARAGLRTRRSSPPLARCARPAARSARTAPCWSLSAPARAPMTQLGRSPHASSGATGKSCSKAPDDGALAPACSPSTHLTTTALPDAATAPSTNPGVCTCSFARALRVALTRRAGAPLVPPPARAGTVRTVVQLLGAAPGITPHPFPRRCGTPSFLRWSAAARACDGRACDGRRA